MLGGRITQVNTIYWGDCKDILSEEFSRVDKYFADVGLSLSKEFADLIYLDPPFFSNRKYEQVFGDDDVVRSFDDNKWGYGLDGLKSSYLPYMRDRFRNVIMSLNQQVVFIFIVIGMLVII